MADQRTDLSLAVVDRAPSTPGGAGTAAQIDVRSSVTARQHKRVRAAIDALPDQAWQPLLYRLSTPEVSDADIAEIPFTVFAGDRRHDLRRQPVDAGVERVGGNG